jgi:lysophospholipase L1-like esterase
VSRVLTSLVVGLSALLCALTTTVVTTPAHAADQVRLLLTGDSITNGRHGDFTWRYRLDRELRRQGVSFQLVGSHNTPYQDPGFPRSTYAATGFDPDHFARAGWQLSEMVGQIKAEVAKWTPGVVVLEAGINDLLKGQSVADLQASLRAWIAQAREGRSDITIVISPLLTETKANGENVNAQVTAYNTLLPEIATELGTEESPIVVAPTDVGWSPSTTYTWDGLHPTPTGETFIAQQIARGLQQAGVLPHEPAIGPRTIAWPHQQVPKVTLAGTTATVSWSRQAVSAGRVRVQRIGGPLRAPATLYRYGTASFAMVRGATYDIRVQLIRGTMVGPWGRALRVRIPAAPVARVPAAPAKVTVTRTVVRWTPAAGARAYLVRARKVGTHRWVTRRTTATQISLKRVAVAKVRSVNAVGHSAWRRDHR